MSRKASSLLFSIDLSITRTQFSDYDQMSVNKRTELKNIKINEMYLAESEKIESEINDLMKQIEKASRVAIVNRVILSAITRC